MPGLRCAVATCNMNLDLAKKKNLSVSFHTFPKDNRRKLWINFCRRGDKLFNPKTAVICSLHFKDEDYEGNLKFVIAVGKRPLLKKSANPILYSPIGEQKFMYASSMIAKSERRGRKSLDTLLDVDEIKQEPEEFVVKVEKVEEEVEDLTNYIEELENKIALVLKENGELKKLLQNMSSKLKQKELKLLKLEKKYNSG